MSSFSDFNDLYEPLTLPIGGKAYVIPPLSFTAGATVNGLIDGKEDESGEEFIRLVLSPEVFEQMVTDGVPDIAITRAGQTALADFKYGRAMAEIMWRTGGDPKAVQALVTQKAPNKAATRSKSTARTGIRP